MRILAITIKDLLQIVRDWKSAAFLLVSPVIFTLFFGFAFGGSDPESDPRLPVVFQDMDTGTYSMTLRGILDQSNVIRLVEDEEAKSDSELLKQVSDGDLAAVIRVPVGYTQGLAEDKSQQITILADLKGNAAITVESELRSAVNQLSISANIASTGVKVFNTIHPEAAAEDRLTFEEQTLQRAVEAYGSPVVQIKRIPASVLAQEETQSNPYAHTAPGMMAQFAIAGLIGAASILVKERKTNSLQRILTTAAGRVEVLLGHFAAMFIMILVQFIILIGFGQIFLKLNYANDWLATGMITVGMAFTVSGMGLLIGVFSKTEEQVVLFTLLPMFVLSGLGGAWVPLEFTPPLIQTIAHLSPVAWMMEGYQDILLRGHTWLEILPAAGALLGFTLFFSAAAAWRFRRVSG